MSLRLIPNIDVIRPSNSIEMEHSYRYAFSDTKNPKVLSLTRQDLNYLDFNVEYEEFIKGGYVVSDGGDFTLVASGSELQIAFEIKATLLEYSVRIVSVPILNKLTSMKNQEINELLKNKYVFPIELGRSIGWENYLGRLTKAFSIDSFGESAPIEDLEKEFGFDVSSITKEIIKYLN
jgi:transketolase